MIVRILVALTCSSVLVVASCSKKTEAPPAPVAAPAVAAAPVAAPAEPAPTAVAPAPVTAAASAPTPGAEPACGEHAMAGAPAGEPACGDKAAAGEPEKKVEMGCEGVGAEQLQNPKVETVTRPDGKTATHTGNAFANVATVKVSELLANPASYAGKTVALEGDVSAMCQHERAWFTVAAEDQSGRFVRVMTAPTFLVPAGSVGLTARAEGTVEVIEVAAEHAKHLAGEHKLGDPEAITANIQQVVVRASGAEFF